MSEVSSKVVGTYEMLWDCDHCGTKRLLGASQRHCAECGGPQNPDKRYFPKEGEEVAVKDGHRFEGADRKCAHCDQPMGAAANNCTSCGAKMDGSQEVKPIAAPQPAPPPKGKPFPVLYVIAGVILLGGLIWWRCIRTKEATMEVTGHRWERSIAVQVFGEVEKDDWENEVPRHDAMDIRCRKEQKSTEQVPDGETCKTVMKDKGNGTFDKVEECTPKTRSEPVYAEKCRYKILDWKNETPLAATGKGLLATWPEQGAPPKEVARVVGAKRQGPRTEKYYLDFGAQSCEVSEAVWKKYADQQKVKLEVRASSGDIVCKTL